MVNTRRKLQFGVYLPDFGKAMHPRALIELAGEAEDYGWDGFFLWDHMVEVESAYSSL